MKSALQISYPQPAYAKATAGFGSRFARKERREEWQRQSLFLAAQWAIPVNWLMQ